MKQDQGRIEKFLNCIAEVSSSCSLLSFTFKDSNKLYLRISASIYMQFDTRDHFSTILADTVAVQ